MTAHRITEGLLQHPLYFRHIVGRTVKQAIADGEPLPEIAQGRSRIMAHLYVLSMVAIRGLRYVEPLSHYEHDH
jgi:hypothetical protein